MKKTHSSKNKYEQLLSNIRFVGIGIEIFLLVFRVYIVKVPSFLSLMQLALVALLCSANLSYENQMEAKVKRY